MKRAALYVRVSTIEQKKFGLSVDNQIQALQEYCSDNNIEVYDVYNDAGHTASKSYKKRAELLRMISDIQSGAIDLVLFTRLDRFFRSVPDYYACLEQMNDVPWRAIWEDYETETANGKFKVNIMLSIAQAEANRTSEKVKSVIEYKRSRGDYIGAAPLGYLKRNNNLIKDPDTEPIVNAFFEEFFNTYSSAKAARVVCSMGINMDCSRARKMIRNTVYRGIAAGGYEVEPYLDEDQIIKLEDYLRTNNVSARTTARTYIFCSLCFCKYCGRRLIGKNNQKMKYYCCSNISHVSLSISEKKLQTYMINNIDAAIDYHINNYQAHDKELVDQSKQIKNLNSKLDRLTILFEEGDIDLEAYKNKRDKIKAELTKIKPISTHTIERLPDNWKEIYNSLDEEHRRSFWLNIVSRIDIDNDKKHIDITFH